jgi:hypothetical protein
MGLLLGALLTWSIDGLLQALRQPPERTLLYSQDIDALRTFQRECLHRPGSWVAGIAPVPDAGWKASCWELKP